MTKKKQQHVHHVEASLKVHELAKAGASLELSVYSRSEIVGKLVIGRGSVEWTGSHRKKTLTLTWPVFAALMDEQYDRVQQKST